MINTNTSICIRCGKQRVVVATHQEVVGSSVVTYTETACPDSVCQGQLDKQLEQEKMKRQESITLHGHRGFTSNRK